METPEGEQVTYTCEGNTREAETVQEARDMRGMLLADDVFCCEESLETVQEKYEKVKDCLDQLRVTGVPVSDEEKEEVRITIEDLKSELQEMKEIMINTARPYLSPKQVCLLEPIEEPLSSDPSIQYFGLEWSLFMTRWKKVEKKIFIYKKNLETHLVDFSRLVSIVDLINSTSVDLSLHLWAIVTDQLSAEKLREQLFMQRKMTYLGEMTKNVKPQPDLTGCTDKSDPCFIEQI